MPDWSPGAWDDFSKVGLLLFLVAFHVIAYMRGWLVPGRHHREIVDTCRSALDKADVRSAKDAETIHVLSETLATKDAAEAVTGKMMDAFREFAERRAGG